MARKSVADAIIEKRRKKLEPAASEDDFLDLQNPDYEDELNLDDGEDGYKASDKRTAPMSLADRIMAKRPKRK